MTDEQKYQVMTSNTIVVYQDITGNTRTLKSKGAVGLVQWIKPNDKLPENFPRVSMQVEFEAEDGKILRLPVDAFDLPSVKLISVEAAK